MKKNYLKYIIFSFVLITLFASFGFSGSVAFATDNKASFDETYVLDDLNGMIINNKQFTVNDYPRKVSGDFELLNLVEFAYTYDKKYSGNYALYAYVYNPSGIRIEADSAQNRIQLACKYNENNEPIDFEKYNIKLCSVSSDGLYLKYKIIDHLVDGKSLYDIVNRDARRYDVTGIEFLLSSTKKIKDYKIGRYFVYSGYAKGMAQESVDESTLKCSYDESETISLKLNHTNFKTCYSGYSWAGTQYNIASIYFSVDNFYLEKYGFLYSLMMEYNKQYIDSVLVIDDEKLFNRLSSVSGCIIDYIDPLNRNRDTFKAGLEAAGYSIDLPLIAQRFYLYLQNSCFEIDNGKKMLLCPIIFYTGGQRANTVTISASELERTIKNYKNSYVDGKLLINGNTYSLDLFDNKNDSGYSKFVIERDKKFKIVSKETKEDLKSIWKAHVDENVYNIDPIEELTLEKVNHAEADKNLFINKADISTVRKYVSEENAKNKTVYIIRFDVSEEHLLEASIWGNDPGGYCSSNNAIYLGLDVIWLKFFNDVNYKVIGVVSDPIDVFSAVSPPPYSRWTGNKLKDALTATTRKIVLSVFGIIVTAFSVLLFTGLFKGFISRIDNIAIKVSFSVITLLLCVALSFAIVFFVSVFIYGKVKNIDFDNAMYVFWRILWPLKGGNL